MTIWRTDFGLKIGIEGENEFKKALREINQDFKVMVHKCCQASSNSF